MHYYKRDIGKYHKRAGRLNMLQHGAYTLLMDSCCDREEFPTLEDAIEWTWACTEEEIAAVKFVLNKFFVLEDGIYSNESIEELIVKYQENSKTNKRIAIERETKRRLNSTKRAQVVNEPCTEGEQVVDESCTKRHLITNQESLITNHESLIINQESEISNKELVTKDPLSIDIDGSKVKSIEVLNYLNKCLDTKYKPTTKSHIENISARLKDHSVEDLKLVINFKIKEWGDDSRMVGYLRPQTLFQASKFEAYLMAARATPSIKETESQYSNTTRQNLANTEGWGEFDDKR